MAPKKSAKGEAPASVSATASVKSVAAKAPTQGPLGQVFGVRHLSPMGAWHLVRFIERVQPTAILIEGPSDATPLLQHLAHADTRPPVALLAYSRPVAEKGKELAPAARTRSILFPFASYSPEWAALTEGFKRGCVVRLMDLPAAVFLGLQAEESQPPEAEEPGEKAGDASGAYLGDPYRDIAALSGDADHDTWWERTFEHNTSDEAYRASVHEFGLQLRALRRDSDARQRENLLRESYMRRAIREAIAEGHEPERVVVVCGAFHSTALTAELPAMTDKELAVLPRLKTELTLMPYSYPRLSSQSGYGAGNHAPAYFQALYEELCGGRPERLAGRYLGELAMALRKQGQPRSSAEVIEAVRLARGMAAMHGEAHAPTLRDLVDAAVTCLAQGNEALLTKAREEVEVGSELGALPKGVTRTALQEDFYVTIKDLGLDEYLKDKAQAVQGRAGAYLDLREDTQSRSKSAALRDRRRSVFFYRLGFLGIAFAKQTTKERDHTRSTYKEAWEARWSPSSELSLVDAALLGDSIEAATARRFELKAQSLEQVGPAAELARQAVECDLPEAMLTALKLVQALAVDDQGFLSIARAVAQLAELVRYRDVRQVDVAPLRPLVAQLFLRATTLVAAAARCDDQGAREVAKAIASVQWVASFEDWADSVLATDRWYAALDAISDTDSDNPFVSGAASAILLERNKLTDAVLERRVALRVSPGSDPGAVAGFFEGLGSRNRMALLARSGLWRSLDAYVQTLDDEEFTRAAVGLRKAFASFSTGEVRKVAELLVGLWGDGGADFAREVEVKLDEAELAALSKIDDELAGLDLDDL